MQITPALATMATVFYDECLLALPFPSQSSNSAWQQIAASKNCFSMLKQDLLEGMLAVTAKCGKSMSSGS